MSRIGRIAVPLLAAHDVIPHLGAPHHWKQGRSAKSVADSWFHANALPASIGKVLSKAPAFVDAELVDAWLERKTDLGDDRASPSQTDLLAVIGIGDQLAILGIEAKVDESFGPTVSEWLADGSAGKQQRLQKLCTLFEVEPASIGHLRYQLFHRCAAAIIEAKRYRARSAVMLVQSFCPKASGLAECQAFFDMIGMKGFDRGNLVGPITFSQVDFWAGWASDRPTPVTNKCQDRP